MTKRLKQGLGVVLSVALFAAAIWVLHLQLGKYTFADVRLELERLSIGQIVAAIGLTVMGYLLLTEYDAIGFRYIKRPLAYPRIALASFIGYSFSHNIGVALLSGGSVRFRIYSAWGLSAIEITKVVFLNGITFGLGYLFIGSVAVLIDPPVIPEGSVIPFTSLGWAGVIAMLIVIAYLVACAKIRRPLRIRGHEFALPSLRLAFAQLAIGSLECILAAGVFYVLLPKGAPVSFIQVLGVYLLGQFVGVMSHSPGGLGVFEASTLFFLTSAVPYVQVLGALLAFRIVYFLLPFALAVVLLAIHELADRAPGVRRFVANAGQRIPGLVPNVLAVAILLGGTLLLLSSARPADAGRLAAIARFVPLWLLEQSHFIGSVAGAALLLLAPGFQRRLRGAYRVGATLVAIGIVSCVFKGLFLEEALTLLVLFAAILTSGRHFYRRGSLLAESISASWIGAMAISLIATTWLGIFAFKNVEYSSELWTRFALHGDLSRFLRALVAVGAIVVLVAVARLIRLAAPKPPAPGPPDFDRARAVVERSRSAAANLALLGDKWLHFSDLGDAFIMYSIEGKCWVALGDPVGPSAEAPELVWRFRERVDRDGGWTVFYDVPAESLYVYVDVGLALVKLGEQARVRLDEFSLAGNRHQVVRRTCDRLAAEGCRFEIVPRSGVAALMPELRAVSDAWLATHRKRESRFSLGCFDPRYLQEFPAAIVRRAGAIVAFANVWTSAQKEELSVDLLRFLPTAPSDVMEFLHAQLMSWGKAEGYRWFDFGSAPLSGVESGDLAPLWNRLGTLVFRHGEHFDDLQSLRDYKEKFDPEWSPRYLAVPSGLALPVVLADIAALIGGNLEGSVVD